jgi:hypothetical protein
VFRHLPLYYTFHVMLGVLMSLYYIRRKARRADLAPEEDSASSPEMMDWTGGLEEPAQAKADHSVLIKGLSGGVA